MRRKKTAGCCNKNKMVWFQVIALALTVHNKQQWFHNESAADKMCQYRTGYNNCPSHAISFMSPDPSTTDLLQCEFVRLLFLEDHRETDLFRTTSGVQIPESTFHYRHTVFSSHIKSKVGNILVKTTVLRINLNIDGSPITSRSHTHPSHSQTPLLLTTSQFLGFPVPHTT